MSLVNDMLKALEARDGLSESDAQYQHDLLAEFSPVSGADKNNSNNIWRSLIIGTALISCTAIYVWFNKQELRLSSPATAPTNHETVFTQESEPALLTLVDQQSIQRDPVLPEDLVSTHTPVAATDEYSAQIQQLLSEANFALKQKRLTDPVDDNAFTRFRSILLLEPSHPDALAGIGAIVEQYVKFSVATTKRGDIAQAENYWVKAKSIASNYPMLAEWLNAQPQPFRTAVGEVSDSLESQSTPVASEATPQQEVREGDDVTHQLHVQLSRRFKDAQVSAEAEKLMQVQRWQDAEQLLVDALATNPQFEKSQKTLFNLFLHQNKVTAAEQLLADLTAMPTAQRNLWRARIHVHQQQWQAALQLLEQIQNQVLADEEFVSLLAAVYHQVGRYRDAVERYQQLLSMNKQNATYWLGLAVCFDAMLEQAEALRAFRFARLYGGLDTSSRDYVEQRISALSLALGAS